MALGGVLGLRDRSGGPQGLQFLQALRNRGLRRGRDRILLRRRGRRTTACHLRWAAALAQVDMMVQPDPVASGPAGSPSADRPAGRSEVRSSWPRRCRELHHRRGQPNLRPERADRSADGDPADPASERDRAEQHDRPALQPGGPCAGAGGSPACRRGPAGACAPAGAPAAAPVAPPEPTTAQRLQQLETLRATGAISDDEYNAKRQQILADL